MGGLITSDKRASFLKLDDTLKECTKEIAEADASGNQMLKTLAVAEATQALRNLLTEPMMASVMSLMGSPLGFRTDRDREQQRYTAAQVKDPLIVAMLRGFRPVGNEMNIIAGNFYATKEGMKRVLRDFQGLTDLKLKAGVPKMLEGGALVEFSATWKLNGIPDSIVCKGPTDTDKSDTRLVIKVNKMMGADAIRGKAESKMLKLIYEQITGSSQGVADDPHELGDAIEGEVVTTTGHYSVVDNEPEIAPADDDIAGGTADDWDAYATAMNEAASLVAVRKLYDATFGPESPTPWNIDQQNDGINLRDERVNAIKAAPGGKLATQKQLT